MVAHVHQDTLDRYYTMPHVVDLCIAALPDLSGFNILEPSSGSGAFASRFPGCLAVDVDPASSADVIVDYLEYTPPPSRWAVVGNPPYGINGALVSRFIKHSATFADLVAFVLPLSYAKPSMHRRWPRRFHLSHEVILPTPNATLNGEPTATRNVWQVWERRSYDREIMKSVCATGWRKCKPDEADAAIRTHGNGLGKVSRPEVANKSSHVFIKFNFPVDTAHLNDHLVAWKWADLNMGQPSAGWDDYAPAINAFVKV